MTKRDATPVYVSARLIQRLQSLADDVALAAEDALREGAHDIADEARALAKQAETSGAIANAIRVDQSVTPQSVQLSVPLDHARYVEFGTRDMPPRPFLQPAVDLHRAAITHAMTQNVQHALAHKGKKK